MAKNSTKTYYVRGYANWFKMLPGQLHDNYDGDAKEWSTQFYPNDTGFLAENKLMDRLKQSKDKETGELVGEKFLQLRRKGKVMNYETGELENNKPVRIVDANNAPWDSEVELGNGTVVDMKISVRDYGKGKKSGIYVDAVRVLELVPYERGGFAPLDENDAYYHKPKEPAAKDTFKQDFGLDDDMPVALKARRNEVADEELA